MKNGRRMPVGADLQAQILGSAPAVWLFGLKVQSHRELQLAGGGGAVGAGGSRRRKTKGAEIRQGIVGLLELDPVE